MNRAWELERLFARIERLERQCEAVPAVDMDDWLIERVGAVQALRDDAQAMADELLGDDRN